MSQDKGKTVAIPQKSKPLDTGFLKGKTTVDVGNVEGNTSPSRAVTVIYAGYESHGEVQAAAVQRFMDNPVVGWLVVIRGAGQGISLPLGNGQNSVGRGQGQRVMLDFGDANISRDLHAIVTYDPLGRSFYLQNGSGINLTYLELMDGRLAPVLSPVLLENGQHIRLGNTTLKFIALCDEHFHWDMVIQDCE